VRPGAQLTAAVTLGALAAGLAASPWLTRDLFGGSWALFWCFEASMVGYGASFLARGVYSGLGDFGGFAQVVACESVGRFALAGVLCLVGVRSAVGFGAAIAVAPLVATALVTRCGRRLRLAPGPVTGRRELLQAFGWLVVASLLGQLLANAAPIAVQVLAPAGEEAAAGRFLSALVVARVSLYLFQAVQATLLPNLAELSARGRTAELRTALRRLLVVGAGLVVVATAGAFVLGPFAVRTLFGPGFTLGAGTLAALAAASMVYVLAAALSNAAVAVSGHWLSTVAWLSGCAAFGVGTAVGRGLYGRVELGYLLGSCVAAAFLLVALPRAIRSHLPAHPREADGGVTDPRPAA
jgi:O-antigen/teichoic acid export membrane protein